MRDGAVLRERGMRWSSWTLQRPGEEPAKITERPINPLREAAFMARDGVLPASLERWYEFSWRITRRRPGLVGDERPLSSKVD